MTEPGWYNDEQDVTLARWHDGVGWTRHTVRKDDWTEQGAPPPPAESGPTAPVEPGTPQGPALGRPESRVPWGTRPDPVIAEPTAPGPRPAAPLPTPQPPAPQAPATAPTPSPVYRPTPAPTPSPASKPAPAPAPAPTAAKAPKPPKAPRAKRPTPKLVTAIRGWERPGWLRWKVVLPIVAGALVLLLLQQTFLTDDPKDPLRSGLPTFGSEWKTADGSSYRITIVPSNERVDGASPGGCIKAPTSGHANVGFAVRIENLSDKAAPMPDVAFAANVNPKGELDLAALSLNTASRNIEVTPRAEDVPCSEASTVRPAGRDKLAKGDSVTFEGVVGGILEPVPNGLALIVRYVQADGSDTGTSSTAEVLAPFPSLTAPEP